LTLKPIRYGAIAGLVLDADTHMPIEDAKVGLESLVSDSGQVRDFSYWDAVRSAKAGNAWNGRFRIENVPEGAVTLVAYAPDYGIARQTGISVRSDETTEVEILMSACGVLEYEVELVGNAASLPVETFAFLSRLRGELEFLTPGLYAAFRNEEWEYENPSFAAEMKLAPGQYEGLAHLRAGELRASDGLSTREYAWFSAPFAIASGKSTEVSVRIGGTASIWGKHPLAGEVGVYAVLAAGSAERAMRELDGMAYGEFRDLAMHSLALEFGEVHRGSVTSGGYRFAALQPGRYTLGLFAFSPDGRVSLLDVSTISLGEGESYFHEYEGDPIASDAP
jgi:hypothetical protein